MNASSQLAPTTDILQLKEDEVSAVSGGIIPLLALAFAEGFVGGVVIFNLSHNRPWYEF